MQYLWITTPTKIPSWERQTLLHTIKMSSNPADMDDGAELARGGGCILLDAAVVLWQTPALRRKEWAGTVPKQKRSTSYGCLAANDKATAQKQMTENCRHQREVFAKRGRHTHSCHRLGLLQIQVILLQLFNPTNWLGFILAFISSCRVTNTLLFPTVLSVKGQRWPGQGDPSLLSETACHAGFLQRILTLFHNDPTKEKRWR